MRNVIICIDGSSCANFAFRWAVEHFLRSEDHVILLHATRDFKNLEPVVSGAASNKDWPQEAIHAYEQKVEEQARLLVAQYSNELLTAGKVKCEAVIVKADPRQSILEHIEKYKPVAVVMGSRGLSLIKRSLLGSVSDYVLHNSDVPVVIIRENNKE